MSDKSGPNMIYVPAVPPPRVQVSLAVANHFANRMCCEEDNVLYSNEVPTYEAALKCLRDFVSGEDNCGPVAAPAAAELDAQWAGPTTTPETIVAQSAPVNMRPLLTHEEWAQVENRRRQHDETKPIRRTPPTRPDANPPGFEGPTEQ